ncbi:MAG: hypothetical protein AABP62_02200 [Planctomycetota bacterium]
MNRKQALAALIGIIAVGLMLRAYRIGDRSLWYDEAFSYSLIHEFTWEGMVHCLQQDVHPPFYFILLRLWSNCFGISIYSLRGFSIAMGGVTLVGIYLFTKDLFVLGSKSEDVEGARNKGRAAGVSAAALVAVFSAHIWWSQDAKMYSLATALISFNAWLLLRAISLQNAQKWWAAYAITAAAMLYTHNYALFTFVGECVFLAVYFIHHFCLSPRRPSTSVTFRHACVAVTAAACLYLPWVPTLFAQARRVRTDYWIAPANTLSIPYALDQLFFPENSFNSPAIRAVGLVLALSAMLAWLVIQRRVLNWLLFSLVLTPILCATLVSLVFASIITPRYFLFASLFVPTVAVSIIWNSFPRLCWGIVCLLVINLLGIHIRFLQTLFLDEQGTRGVVSHLLENRKSSEPVIVTHAGVFYSVKYYAEETLHAKLFLSSGTLPHYLGGSILVQTDAICSDEMSGDNYDTIWVVDCTGFVTVPAARSSIPDSWLPVSGSQVSFREVFGWQGVVTAQLYRRL